MSLTEIEAQLPSLKPDELRHLAVKSWTTFVQKEGLPESRHVCDEADAALLSALDEAAAEADRTPRRGCSGDEVRARIAGWSSK